MAVELARLAEDLNCTDVVLLDLRGRSPVTDYFLIATGTSDRQRRSVADDMAARAKEQNYGVLGVSGLEEPSWVLLDLFDIVVHLFDEDTRKYYDLDLLWGDAPHVRWQRPQRKTSSSSE